MSDMYLEVLQNYLNGSEWRQSVEMFVASNCKYFQNIGEMDHQQHDIWKRFQDVVEMVLESALDSIGGNIQKLEEALDAVHNQPSRGPRDDLVKDVLERLLSFTDFESFASMMKLAYDNMDGDSDSNAKHVDSLLRMGFRIDAIDAVLGDAPPGSSLEDLVMALSAYVSDNTGASASHGQGQSYGGDAKYSYDVHDSRPGSPGDGGGAGRRGGKGSSKETLSLLKFVKEAADEGLIIDENELNAKFVIAESVLDSFDRSARAELGPADAMLGLIRWAEDMKMLAHDALLAFEEELPCSTMCFNCKDGLVEWYRALEVTRSEMDQSAVAGNMLSDAELRRMAELDKIAAMGTADEQLLHSLIGRHEEVTREVNGLHRQCGLLVASERGIKRENLEELYLYLKQQVANGMDLDMITDELHDHVYSLVSSARGAEVTNLLLDMHIYEDEQHMLKQRIDTLLGIPPGRAEPQVDFLGEDVKDVHVEGEFAGGEQSDDGHGRFDQHGADDKYSPSAESDSKDAHSAYGVLSPSKQSSGGENESPSKLVSPSHGGLGGIGGVNMNIAQRMQQEGQSMFSADGKGSAQGDAANLGSNGTTGAAGKGGANSEAYLGSLKDQHRTSIAQLKELLDSEKARRLKALEDKLMRRRALQQAQQRKGGESKGEEDLATEHARSVKEVEVEIEEVQTKFDGMTESMVSGLKKRCLNEIMVARKNHDKELLTGADPDGKHSGGPLLSEEDRSEAHRAAADSIKQRFERDQKALLDSLERERAKQHERVAKQMAAKRKARLASGASEATVAAEEQAALNAMNLEFDVMQATALSSAQEHALLALSAIHLTEADLAADKAHSGDEDDYLNEDNVTSSGGSLAKGRDWLDRVDQVKGSYMGAAADLIQRLRVNAVTTAGVVDSSSGAVGGDGGQAFGEVAGLMSKVVADAFDNQLLEEAASREHGGASQVSSKFMKKADGKSDAARLKAGILEEFERAKRQMDENLLSAQQASKNKLSDRRNGNKGRAPPGGNSHGAEGKEDDTTSEEENAKQVRLQKLQGEIMEGVVDAFLGGEPVPDIAAAYTAAAAQNAQQQQHVSQQRRSSAEWEEDEREKERARIKNSHAQKEQSLLQDLQANMLEKKRALEDRLRRKRQNGGSSSGHSGTEEGGAETHQQEEAEVNMLNEAFEKLTSQLKGMSKEQLSQLDLNMLMDLMERSANGERVAIPAGSPLKPIMTNATLVRPMAVTTKAEEKQSAPVKETELASPNPFSISPTHLSPLPALAPIVPNRRVSVSEEKEAMAGEVKRISLEYNEEKQKLDLMMKIQQARQRQSLQRKLFEKNQRKQQQQRETDGLYEGEEGDDDDYNEHGDGKSEYNSVEIGANRGLSNLKLKQSTVQPAFRGLPADAYRSGNSAGGGAGYSSGAKPTNQAMALRGMNLGPMMRK